MGQDRIWDYFQSESKGVFVNSQGRLNAIVKLIRPGQKVLNIGLGSGMFERLAISRQVDVYSLDPSAVSIEKISQELSLGDKARVGLANSIPFEDSLFDVVVMSEVIEHIPSGDLDAAMREVRRVLKPGGRLVGTVPAKENLQKNEVICPNCGSHFHRWGHVQSFDLVTMRALLEGYFEINRLEQRYLPIWSNLNWKEKLETGLLFMLHKIGVELSNENIFFVVSRRSS